MNIAILGSGFSGIFAALACIDKGVDFALYSDSKTKPVASGFQYLHDRCGMKLKPHNLFELLAGKEADYTAKIYRNQETISSASGLTGNRVVYNLSDATDLIWPEVKDKIIKSTIKEGKDLNSLLCKHDLVVSSIPAFIFYPNLKFAFQTLYCYHMPFRMGLNFVVYNGYLSDSVTRMGCLFDNLFIESLDVIGDRLPVFEETIQKKIIPNNFTIISPNDRILYIGRYGLWKKGCLIHDGYYDTLRFLNEKRV